MAFANLLNVRLGQLCAAVLLSVLWTTSATGSRALNVRPAFPVDQRVDRRIADVELASQIGHARLIGSIATTNLGRVALGELGSAGARTTSIPPLGRSISYVVGIGAKKKMIWSDAGWIVAPMKNVQSFGDQPMHEDPRQAMNAHGAPLDGDPAVSLGVAQAIPKPAITDDFDEFKNVIHDVNAATGSSICQRETGEQHGRACK